MTSSMSFCLDSRPRRDAVVLPEPPREGGAVGQGVLAAAPVGEDLRRALPGQAGHVDGVELQALGLVDGHDLHRVGVGEVGLGQVVVGLVEQLEVLHEGPQPGVALDGGEALGQVEEPQQVLPPEVAGGPPQAGALDDGLGQLEHGHAGGGRGQGGPLGHEAPEPAPGGLGQVGHGVDVGEGGQPPDLGLPGVAGDGGQVAQADAVPRALQDAQQGDGGAVVGQELEPGHQVDDLGAVEQAAGADDLDRHPLLLEGGDDRRDEPALAAQHGGAAARLAVGHPLGDVAGDGGRLLGVVGGEEALDGGVGRSRRHRERPWAATR